MFDSKPVTAIIGTVAARLIGTMSLSGLYFALSGIRIGLMLCASVAAISV